MLPDEAVVQRLLAQESLREFVEQAWHVLEPVQPFVPNFHIDAICDHLQAVYNEEIQRLLINIPPRHMKSLSCSVGFPAWAWIKKPHLKFLFSSYAQELSTRDSVKTRRLIQSPWYQRNWGDKFWLVFDQNQKTRFENNRTGYRLATSVGGLGTGEGGDIIVVDDPHNVKEGESDTKRNDCLFWWDETMSSRLNNPDRGAYVIIMQRVHQKDLAGHVMEQGGYVHLCLPGEYEGNRVHYPKNITVKKPFVDPRSQEGELLWPERFTTEAMTDLKTRLGSYGYAAQVQQRPAPRGGGYFQRQWFPVVNRVPFQTDHRLRFWDLAATKEERKKAADPDWTAGVLMSRGRIDGVNKYCIENVVRFRDIPAVVERSVKNTASQDGRLTRIMMEQEPGAAGKSIISHYQRNILQGYNFRGEPSTGAKEQYADLLSAAAEQGLIFLLRGEWNEDFLAELEMFPKGTHDDQVDSASKAYFWLGGGMRSAGAW
jgi:predicted phage terminase large subunit-like protein